MYAGAVVNDYFTIYLFITLQGASGSRPGSAKSYSKTSSPTRAPSRTGRSPSSRPGSRRSSPVRRQTSSKHQSSTSRSNSPRKCRQASDKRPEVKAQHKDASAAAVMKEAQIEKQSSTVSGSAQLKTALARAQAASSDIPATVQTLPTGSKAEAVPAVASQVPSKAQQDRKMPSTATVQADTALGKSAVLLQADSHAQLIDITVDEPGSSQVTADASVQAAAAGTPTGAPSVTKDVVMAEAEQASDDVPSADAAEAFISLELEDAKASKSMSPTRLAKQPVPGQSDQTLQHTLDTGRQASAVAAPAVPVQDRTEKQAVATGNTVTEDSLRLSASYSTASKASAPANGNAVSATGLESAAAVGTLHTEQKMLSATRTKAVGKGGIQIVVATKHKEVSGHACFPADCCYLGWPACTRWIVVFSMPLRIASAQL